MTKVDNTAFSAPYDVEKVRKDFPILSTEVYGKPLVYLDNGASAQKPMAVIDAITKAYTQEYANVHRGLHYLSNTATENFEAAREITRRFLNAPSVDEVIFTKSTTEAINLVSYGLEEEIQEGDEIIISILEHHSNIVPWNFLRERKGAVIKWAPIAEDGTFLMEEFEKLLSDRTKIVAVTHMSNVTGTVVPVKEVTRLAHEYGAKVLIDGSQGAVHMPVDVQDIGCDFYAITGHKLYGPSGIGALYGKKEILNKMRPFQGGGEMIKDVTETLVTYAEAPHRFEAGTPPIVQAIGLGAALDYIDSLGRENIAVYEASLRDYAEQRLKEVNSLKIFGNSKDKGSIFSFEIEGVHAHDISMVIDREGVAVRAGTHCAQPLLARFGVTSTCRASFGLYNTHDEVDRMVEALRKAQMMFG
ncbi:Cysteine desulfurase [Pseudovibrio axinellae]|uniref:Cysteine desulfurase n=1 Tax=Pseudovibrio axinellae TaxID=989403 RepID=A0A165XCU4_9HYPH|nr:cysteine desulfurase [Pseudovibrio axinellae]KZL17580.1 Cysteine desulfurase [Pseudovibrio axinellae]SER32080.1 cysteine desulfurase [Pseudovibrio axinellae]